MSQIFAGSAGIYTLDGAYNFGRGLIGSIADKWENARISRQLQVAA